MPLARAHAPESRSRIEAKRWLAAGLVAATGACSSAPILGTDSQFGPMAVVASSGRGTLLARAGTGVVEITRDCVTLRSRNGPSRLLVWRSAEVEWDPLSRAVLYKPAREEGAAGPQEIQQGDFIDVGGVGSAGPQEGDVHGNLKWLAPPHEDCPEAVILVHGVEPGYVPPPPRSIVEPLTQ